MTIPETRDGRRELAARIIKAVADEQPLMLPLEERHVMSYDRSGPALRPAYLRTDVEALVLALADEIVCLTKERR